MNGSLEGKLKVSYESNLGVSYLVMSIPAKEKILEHQVEMITQTKADGILPLHIRHINETIKIYFQITSKIKLSQYAKRKKLSKREFIGILESMTAILLNCKGYLLSDKCFLLDEEYIYVHPGENKLFLAYVPVLNTVDVQKNFKDFLISLIVQTVEFDDSITDNFIQKLLSCLRSESFSLLDFQKQLTALKADGSASSAGTIASRRKTNDEKGAKGEKQSVYVPGKEKHQSGEYNLVQKKENVLIPGGAFAESPISCTESRNCSQKGIQPVTSIKKYSVNPYVLFGLVNAVTAGIIIWLYLSGAMERSGTDPVSAGGGFGITLVGINYIIYRILSGQMQVVKNMQKETLKKQGVNLEKENYDDLNGNERKNMDYYREINSQKVKEHEPGKGASLPSPEGSFETTLLGLQGLKTPRLKGMNNGNTEEVKITKPEFAVGKFREQVDYLIDNKAVSRVHAELLLKRGSCFIKDLNSLNGTFVNGSRLESNKEFEIKNNDRVTFAGSEFVFLE